MVYYDKDRIDRCAAVIITVVIVFMLVVPIYLEYHIVVQYRDLASGRENAICMGILVVFTLMFSAIVSCFTKARRHELLGASAA